MMKAKLWGLAALAAMSLLAWVFRYETIPVQTGGPVPAAYLVNRWTGTAYMMRGSVVSEVEVPATSKLVEIDYEPRPLNPPPGLFDDVLKPEAGGKTSGKAPNPFDQFDR